MSPPMYYPIEVSKDYKLVQCQKSARKDVDRMNATQKKILKDVWVVRDCMPNGEPLYFAGLSESQTGQGEVSRFEPLSVQTKTYKNKRAADSAARIANSHYESPFVSSLFLEYAEVEDIPDVEKKISEAPKPPYTAPVDLPYLDLVPESEYNGWIMLDRLCGKFPVMLRKKVGEVFRFAIAFSDKERRYLPADEVFAWNRYFDECKAFVTNKIRNRRIAEGKNPDGADEWKKGGT